MFVFSALFFHSRHFLRPAWCMVHGVIPPSVVLLLKCWPALFLCACLLLFFYRNIFSHVGEKQRNGDNVSARDEPPALVNRGKKDDLERMAACDWTRNLAPCRTPVAATCRVIPSPVWVGISQAGEGLETDYLERFELNSAASWQPLGFISPSEGRGYIFWCLWGEILQLTHRFRLNFQERQKIGHGSID